MTEGEEGRATEWRLSARCHSVPPLSFCPPIVILSEAKNLPSRLGGMARKILRSEAPQNDREEETVPPNDSSLVILSEAKNLFSCPRDMARKILRSEAPQNDKRGKTAPQNDRGGGRARLRMTERGKPPLRMTEGGEARLRMTERGKPPLRMTGEGKAASPGFALFFWPCIKLHTSWENMISTLHIM